MYKIPDPPFATRLIVDTQGIIRCTDDEPLPGSVVLARGLHGTAWQRHFADGLWYPASHSTGRGRTWAQMLNRRNLVLVYSAPNRKEDKT